MTQKTNAARLLDQTGIQYELREYEVDPEDLAAEAVAAKIGLPPWANFQDTRGAGRSARYLHGRDSGRYGVGPEGAGCCVR